MQKENRCAKSWEKIGSITCANFGIEMKLCTETDLPRLRTR